MKKILIIGGMVILTIVIYLAAYCYVSKYALIQDNEMCRIFGVGGKNNLGIFFYPAARIEYYCTGGNIFMFSETGGGNFRYDWYYNGDNKQIYSGKMFLKFVVK